MWLEDKNQNYFSPPTCVDCGMVLSRIEERYYGNRCEQCEGKWFEAMERAKREA